MLLTWRMGEDCGGLGGCGGEYCGRRRCGRRYRVWGPRAPLPRIGLPNILVGDLDVFPYPNTRIMTCCMPSYPKVKKKAVCHLLWRQTLTRADLTLSCWKTSQPNYQILSTPNSAKKALRIIVKHDGKCEWFCCQQMAYTYYFWLWSN